MKNTTKIRIKYAYGSFFVYKINGTLKVAYRDTNEKLFRIGIADTVVDAFLMITQSEYYYGPD